MRQEWRTKLPFAIPQLEQPNHFVTIAKAVVLLHIVKIEVLYDRKFYVSILPYIVAFGGGSFSSLLGTFITC